MTLTNQVSWLAAAAMAVGLPQSALAQSAADTRPSRRPSNIPARRSPLSGKRACRHSIPLNFSGPKWKELTGIDVKVVEVPAAEMFTKIMQDYRSGAGAYDALNVIPAWMPDLANAGALEPLDAYVDKYGFRDELQKIAPTYRDNQMMVDGKIYGFPDDGDVFVMYYRKDVLGDPANQAEFKAKYGTDLPCRPTWKEFDEVGQFLTDKYCSPRCTARPSSVSRPTGSSCSRSASATKAASSSTATP